MLRWGDVNWRLNRITVRSPKTERHQNKTERVIPLFSELRPHLETVLDEFLENFDPKAERLSEQPVITRYRDSNANLRTQFCRIIRAAKLEPWPKLFQNLRSTRATELAAIFPAHVAAEWLGHSTVVAEKHYWRVTDSDFERAVNAQQKASEGTGMDQNDQEQKSEKPGDCENHRVLALDLVLPVGIEPTTY
jgi:integrase